MGIRLPQTLRGLLSENAISNSMIPIFQGIRNRSGKKAALDFSGRVLSTLMIFALPLSLLIWLFAEEAVAIIAPGLLGSEYFSLSVLILRLALPFVPVAVLVFWQGSVLMAFRKFSSFGFTWGAFNIGFLVMSLWLYWQGSDQIAAARGFAWVFLPGMAWLALFLYTMMRREGLPMKAAKPGWQNENMRNFRGRFYATLGGVSFPVINSLILLFFASFLEEGTISILYYAERLANLPSAVLGTAVAMVLLPALSSRAGEDDESALRIQAYSLGYGLLFSLPAAIGLAMLPEEIIHVLFGRGLFTPQDVERSAAALKLLALGIPFVVWGRIFLSAFYSRGDPVTPLKINFFCSILLAASAWVLSKHFGYVGLAGALVIMNVFACLSQYIILQRRGCLRFGGNFIRRSLMIFFAGSAMAALIWWGKTLFVMEYDSFIRGVLYLSAFVFSSAVIYASILWLAGTISFKDLRKVLADDG